ncbi:MAG: glucoamylase family protein [Saprospiraceae bacterium]
MCAAAPENFRARGFDSHVELRWNKSNDAGLTGYKIYWTQNAGSNWYLKKLVSKSDTAYIDFVGVYGANLDLQYKITGITTAGETDPSATVDVSTKDMSDDELSNMVEEYTFRYFWDFAHPVSGLARERNTSEDIVTIGGSGFGLMAIVCGMQRNFISRQEGIERLQKIAGFLATADRFHGAWPHWMNGVTGKVIPFSPMDNGGDLVETAFMVEGILTVRQYLNTSNPQELALYNQLTQLWESVEWSWYRKPSTNSLYWHWSPNFGWAMNFPIKGFNECMIAYILAVASPTHPVTPGLYVNGWVGSGYKNNKTFYGTKLSVGPDYGGPLFFAHYSYIGLDLRDLKDSYANYFQRNTAHTLINRAYCIDNPKNFTGYSAECWGLTASDNPFGYSAQSPTNDNGTITPTAALSSMPYTPTYSLDALKFFYRQLGPEIWGFMGFSDAFNLEENWFADSYLAIDQGPIIDMIENHRSGLLWSLFMSNPEINPALSALGFVADPASIDFTDKPAFEWNVSSSNQTINIEIPEKAYDSDMQIMLINQEGKTVHNAWPLQAAKDKISLTGALPNGIYVVLLMEDSVPLGAKSVYLFSH